MLPASSLEAILGAMFIYDRAKGFINTKKIYEFGGVDVLNRV